MLLNTTYKINLCIHRKRNLGIYFLKQSPFYVPHTVQNIMAPKKLNSLIVSNCSFSRTVSVSDEVHLEIAIAICCKQLEAL